MGIAPEPGMGHTPAGEDSKNTGGRGPARPNSSPDDYSAGMRKEDKTRDAWTHYWRSGRLATCFVGMGHEQAFELREFWAGFFRDFENDAVLLDICTGNGAVALLAAETALEAGRTWFVHGADIAEIRPHASVRNAPAALRNVRFWPGVAMEQLPFEDGAIDGISGQYALEYTDRARSIPELARVLRPGGRIRLLLHAREGKVVESAAASLNDLKRLFEELRIFRSAQAAFTRLYPSGADPASQAEMKRKHKAVLEDFEARLDQLSRWAASEPVTDIVKFVAERLSALYANRDRYRPQDIFAFLRTLEQEVRHYRERMKSISRAALSEAEVTAISDSFAAQGLSMEPPKRLLGADGGDLLGWTVAGHRPDREMS